MKNKAILVSFVALFAMILTLAAVTAITTSGDFVKIDRVEANDVVLTPGTTYVGQVSDTIPIDVELSALKNVTDRVKVKVYIEGFKDDIEESVVLRTPLEKGIHGYTARFSLKFPSTMDIEDISEDLTLNIRVSAQGEDAIEESYSIRMERDLYSLNILSIEASEKAAAGSTVEMNVVLQNNGAERLDNIYVKASIPELGIERKVYFGDIGPNPESDEDYYSNIRDTTERKVYLTIPRNANPGTYNIEVEAYNYDTSTTAKKKVVVSGLESGILPGVAAKTISIGEEATFNVVLVNPNDRMVVYSITPEESKGLIISVEEPIVSVPADSSKTVKVKVKATNSAEEGTHLVTVNVNTESGLVKQVSYSVNIEKPKTTGGTVATNSVLILTVILVIIFVVLLIVLIVLLTRKPAETEEFGETSYY